MTKTIIQAKQFIGTNAGCTKTLTWTIRNINTAQSMKHTNQKGESMTLRPYNEKELARFAADTMVLILFVVLLNVILVFGILLYALAWLVGLT